jgi:hypothetical protein
MRPAKRYGEQLKTAARFVLKYVDSPMLRRTIDLAAQPLPRMRGERLDNETGLQKAFRVCIRTHEEGQKQWNRP